MFMLTLFSAMGDDDGGLRGGGRGGVRGGGSGGMRGGGGRVSSGRELRKDRMVADTSTKEPTKWVNTHTGKVAKLEISGINVDPNQPQAEEEFTVKIKVTNVGEITSQEYDLEKQIMGQDRKVILKGKGLKPGESHIFPSSGWVVMIPGRHEMQAKIKISTKDITINNPMTNSFTVKGMTQK